jgi:ribosomal-protein-alanine N-acetyltransferase
MQKKIIINDETYLSTFTNEDVAALITHLSEKQISDQTLMIPYPYKEENAKWFIEFAEKNKKLSWAIRGKNSQLIGSIGFHGESKKGNHCDEIGYWLAKPYWGRGIVTEAVKKLCEYGFDKLNLVRIEAPIFAFNIASCRVVEKCGFIKEGIMRKAYFKNGEFIDGVMYALVK